MVSRAERAKQGEEAKARVLARTYGGATSIATLTPAANSRAARAARAGGSTTATPAKSRKERFAEAEEINTKTRNISTNTAMQNANEARLTQQDRTVSATSPTPTRSTGPVLQQPTLQQTQYQLGQVQPQSNPFQNQPDVSSDLLRSNPNVRAPVQPVAQGLGGKIGALIGQIHGNPVGPSVELPSTGSKALDTAGNFVGQTAGQIIQTEGAAAVPLIAKGLEYGAARAIPKLAPYIMKTTEEVAPTLAQRAAVTGVRAGVNAATGAIENTAAGAAIGQTDNRQLAENAIAGVAFGGGGTIIGAGVKAAGRKVADVAEDLVRNSLRTQQGLGQAGESALRANAGKQILADIDEQLSSLSTSKAPDKSQQYASLLNERKDAVSYIKQHEPDFAAEKPRITYGGVQPEVRELPRNLTPETIAETPQTTVPQSRKVRASKITNQPGVRKFVQSVEQSPNTSEGVKAGLAESPGRFYKQTTNAGQLKRANRAIAKDADAVESSLLSKTKYTGDDVVKGIRTMQELQRAGHTERAVNIAERMAKHLTEAGQVIQAADVLDRISPEGLLIYTRRKVNKINEKLLKGQEPVKITPEQDEAIVSTATALQKSGESGELSGNVLQLMTKARNGESLNAEEKQTIYDFVQDAKQYVKKADTKAPEVEKLPKEFRNKELKRRVTTFLDKQEQAAKDRIKARKNRFNSTPFDEWADYAIIAASKMAKGAIRFGDFTTSMIRDFGEEVRPQLRNLYRRGGQIMREKAQALSEKRLTSAEQVAEKYLKSNEARLSPEDIDLVRNLAEKVSEASGKQGVQASQDLHALLNSFERVGVGRKLAATQYIAMLLNPLTQIRNVAGNELMYRLERLARFISTPIDIAASKITGGPRTITFKSGPSVWDDFFAPTTDYWGNLVSGYKAGARGLNPAGLSNINEIGGLAFRSKYNPLLYLEKALGGTMKGFDHAAYMRSYNQQLREMAYLDALNKGVKGKGNIKDHMVDYMANLDNKAKEIADKYGQYSTLQNDSLLAQKLSGFKRGVNQLSTLGQSKEFGLGNAILPFAKTPANLLLRSLDYSPAGIIRAAKQTYDIVRDPKTDLTRADVIANVSRALLGTGIGGLGYYLADMGVLQGKSSDDPEVRKLMAQSGVKDFQINGTALRRALGAMVEGGDVKTAAKMQPGDTLWGYQWAAPTSAPLAVGNTIYQGKEDKAGAVKTAGKSVLNGLQTLFDSSVLRSLTQAFQTQPGQDNSVTAFGTNVLKNLPGTFLPSVVRQVNTLLNNDTKETYSPDTLSNYINPTYQNVPGNELPQRVDTLGRPVVKPSTFFDVFLNPAARTKYQPTPEAKFAIDLINETGDNTLAPRAVSKYITSKGVKQNLTTEQYVKLQTLVGQKTAELIDEINPNGTTEEKSAAMLKALSAAGTYGRNELKKEIGLQ